MRLMCSKLCNLPDTTAQFRAQKLAKEWPSVLVRRMFASGTRQFLNRPTSGTGKPCMSKVGQREYNRGGGERCSTYTPPTRLPLLTKLETFTRCSSAPGGLKRLQ